MTAKPRAPRKTAAAKKHATTRPTKQVEPEILDAEIVDDDAPGTAVELHPSARSAGLAPRAVGDTIYLQMLRPVTGYGAVGDNIQIVESLQSEALVAGGYAVVVSSPTTPVIAPAPTSIRWQPYTHYPAGWLVVNPSGQLVTANTDFVSAGSYSAGNWTVVNDTGSGGGSVTKAAVVGTGVLVTDLGGPADLTDRSSTVSETVPAGRTTNATTAGVTLTAPAPAGTVGTPPQRFAIRNGSTGTITVSYPDTTGTTQALTVLAGEVLTFRQKTTSGYAAESGNKTLGSLDARFGPSVPSRAARISPAAVIAGTQTGHTWTVSGTVASSNLNDTSDFALGSQCVSFTSDGTQQTVQFANTMGSAVDMTGKGLVVWLKVSDWGAFQSNVIDIQIINAAGTDGIFAYPFAPQGAVGMTDATTYGKNGEWVPFYIPWMYFNATALTGVSASGTFANIRSTLKTIRVRCYVATGKTVTVKVGGVGTYSEPTVSLPNGLVSFTFDDSYASTFSIARPYLDKYGMRATLFPIVDILGSGGCYTLAQLQQMHDANGFEVGWHASTQAIHTARWTSLSTAALQAELSGGRAWLTGNGFGDSGCAAYPGGELNLATERAVSQYFPACRTVFGRTPELGSPPKPGRVKCLNAASFTLAQLQAYVDIAKSSHCWMVFVFHDIAATLSGSDPNQQTTANFTGLVDYVNTQGCKVLPMGEAAILPSVT